MNASRLLNETDLQLYLARAMPWNKRLVLSLALWADAGLRAHLRDLRAANDAFRQGEMRRLRARLFPDSATATLAAAPAPPLAGSRGRAPSQWGGLAFACACLAVVSLAVLPWLTPPAAPGDEEVIPHGRALGINLFVKGDRAYRVEKYSASVASDDTLQVAPLGASPEHLVLLGWDARQGVMRLFPQGGEFSRAVSRSQPPPALLLQGMDADHRLICVTSTAPFRVAEAESLLRREPFLPMDKAPPTRLEHGLFLQVFTISRKEAGPGVKRGRI